MFPKRSIAIVISAAFACGALAGCHGKPDDSNSKRNQQEAASERSGSMPSQSNSASNGALKTRDGLILSFCPSSAKGIRNVEFVKPADGEITKTNSFPITPMKFTSAADCNSNLTGAKMRSIFNRRFTAVAVADDVWHTGTIKATHGFQNQTPHFVDLATGLNGKPPVSTIQQSSGAFGPDGWLYFVQKKDMGDNPKVMKVNPTNGVPKAVNVNADVSGFDPTSGAYQLFFTSGNATPQTDSSAYQVFSPDGKYFIAAGDGTITYGKVGTDGTITEPKYGHTVWPFGYIGPKEFFAVTESGLVRATIDGKNVKEQPLIPATSAKIIDPTLGSNGQNIAYIEETDSTRILYTVPTNGGPRHKVMELDRTVLSVRILDYTGK